MVERISAIGEFANIGAPLIRLLDLSSIEISARGSNEEIEQIEVASKIAFEYSGQHYPARLRTILPTINSQTRNREVRLLFTDGPALTGAAGKLIWNDHRPHIPANLVVRREDKLGIFTEEKGIAIFIPVANAMAGRSTPVDLVDDTHLIIEGHFAIQDKTPVHITE